MMVERSGYPLDLIVVLYFLFVFASIFDLVSYPI